MKANSIKVPNSDMRLVDGSIVILARFPGTKWVVHNGWYRYNGSQYSGWYFSSIPAHTIIPVNQQDLTNIVLVAGTYPITEPDAEVVSPDPHWENENLPGPGPIGCPGPPPMPTPHPPFPPAPGPCPPWPPGPPPGPSPFWPYPPKPPGPEPDLPSFFSVKKDAMLSAAFISVPTLKHRDNLPLLKIPDGKIVRVNSVNGKPAYYIWSQYDDEWKQVSVQAEIEAALESYYDKGEIDEIVQTINDSISATQADMQNIQTELQSNIDEVVATHAEDTARIDTTLEEIQEDLSELHTSFTESIEGLDARLTDVEDAIYNVKKLAEISGSNTVLVSDEGGISDSGVSIGDDEIGEPSEYADDKTLATEKAVVKKVEESTPKWASF